MTFLEVILYAAVILVALLLIALVLVQQSKGGGFGGAFGGLGESIFGAQAGSHLTKMTVILGSVFFVLVLAIAVVIAHHKEENSNVDALIRAEAAKNTSAVQTEVKNVVNEKEASAAKK